MKQKDLALIIVLAVISAIVSYFVSGMFITKPTDLKADVKVVDPISADIPEVDTRYFNSDSIDPTEVIKIGGQENQQPF